TFIAGHVNDSSAVHGQGGWGKNGAKGRGATVGRNPSNDIAAAIGDEEVARPVERDREGASELAGAAAPPRAVGEAVNSVAAQNARGAARRDLQDPIAKVVTDVKVASAVTFKARQQEGAGRGVEDGGGGSIGRDLANARIHRVGHEDIAATVQRQR